MSNQKEEALGKKRPLALKGSVREVASRFTNRQKRLLNHLTG